MALKSLGFKPIRGRLATGRDKPPFAVWLPHRAQNSIASHEFPCHNLITKTGSKGAPKTPRRSRLSYRRPFSNKAVRRHEQHLPQVAPDKDGTPKKGQNVGTRAADRAVAAARSALSFRAGERGGQ